jgi:hypothetical protein
MPAFLKECPYKNPYSVFWVSLELKHIRWLANRNDVPIQPNSFLIVQLAETIASKAQSFGEDGDITVLTCSMPASLLRSESFSLGALDIDPRGRQFGTGRLIRIERTEEGVRHDQGNG